MRKLTDEQKEITKYRTLARQNKAEMVRMETKAAAALRRMNDAKRRALLAADIFRKEKERHDRAQQAARAYEWDMNKYTALADRMEGVEDDITETELPDSLTATSQEDV